MHYQYKISYQGKVVVIETDTTDKALALWRALKWSKEFSTTLGIFIKGVMGYITLTPSSFIITDDHGTHYTEYNNVRVQMMRGHVDTAIKV